MQYPKDELEWDADHISSLVECDPKFAGVLKSLTHQDVVEAVAETFNLLHSAHGPQDEGGELDLTPEGCLVVAILQQMLVRLLAKRLMNLITAEAVILNRNKIPSIYLWHYLGSQTHFSLKDTIRKYHGALKATISYVNNNYCI